MTDMRQAALDAFDHGFDIALLAEGSKTPWRAGWNERPAEREEIDFCLRRYRLNYGVLLRGVCVLDKDGRSKATTEFLKEHRVRSPMEVRTRNGTHVYMRVPAELQTVRTRITWLGLGLDVKLTGCAVGLGSVVAGWVYRPKAGKRLVHRDELPELPASLVNLLDSERQPQRQTLPDVRGIRRGPIRNPKAYCLRVPSHMGSGGSRGLVRCVCVCRDGGMSSRETFEFLVREWNREPRVTPPWTEAEIAYAVRRHFGEPT